MVRPEAGSQTVASNGTVLDNVMTINASHTTPVDSVLIPTGQIAPVEGTPFDFREPHAIGERIGADNQQLRNGGGYDHNWVIDRKTESGIEQVATVWEPAPSPLRLKNGWFDMFTTVGLSVVAL